MNEIYCTECGEEAVTVKEFTSGKCRFCSGELSEEDGNETAESMGKDSDLC